MSDYDKYERRWIDLKREIGELTAEVKAMRADVTLLRADVALLKNDMHQRQQMDARQRNLYIRKGIPFHFQPDTTIDSGPKSLMERIFGD